MNHSTTGTSSYILFKYSRSYPTKRTIQKNQTTSQNGPELASDWQHFTNPVIRLVLDVKTTNNGGDIESVKLRILWEINSGLDGGSSQPDVVFEDLDLLSFSTIASNVARKHQTEGLPLKAVYRDTVVGIRYLHSREDGTTPVYRRFQISFQTSSEASDFVELIKPICPCKLNPINAGQTLPAVSQSQMPAVHNRPATRTLPTNLTTAKSFLPDRGSPYACPPPLLPSITAQQRIPRPSHTPVHEPSSTTSFVLSSSPLRQQTPSDAMSSTFLDFTSSGGHNTSRISPNQGQEHAPIGLPSSSGGIVFRDDPIPDTRTVRVNSIPAVTTNLPSSSLPSLPCSDNSAQASGPASTFRTASAPEIQREVAHPLLSSLVEASSIYNLPNHTLEQAIGEFIHEDGFVQLLERVSEMLTVRTLLDAA